MKDSSEIIRNLKDGLKNFGQKIKHAAGIAKDFVMEHKKIAIPAGVVIIVAVFAVIAVTAGKKEGTAAGTIKGLDSEAQNAIPVPDVPLEECSDGDINGLIVNYFTALANGDLDTIISLKSYVSDKEKISIQEKSSYIEAYPNVTCYVKPGPMKDSYVAYVLYDLKFYNVDTVAPGVKSYLINKNEEGNYQILDGEMDQNIGDYLLAISAQEDVEDLFNRATVKYQEAKEADPALSSLLETMPNDIKETVSVELAKLEAPTETETETETETAVPETETAAETETPEENVPQVIVATDVVNIRTSDSETADKIGKTEIGQQFTLLEAKGNGWSKIEVDGKEAYVKSEYFTAAAEAPAQDAEEVQEPEPEQAAGTGETVTVKETVNIRASANESGKKIGAAYQGEQLELVMKQADGWTKIKYKGQTAYVKSEFLE